MPIKAKEERYIYPPRAATAVPRGDTAIFAKLRYIAQLKYNDSRCLIKMRSDGHIELWNRHAEMFRGYTPHVDLMDQLRTLHTGEYTLYDGGLLHAKHAAIKHTIVIWDVLVRNGEALIGTTYKERFATIQALATDQPYYHTNPDGQNYILGLKITDDILTPINIGPQDWDAAWDLVDAINKPWIAKDCGPLIEGLVYKDPTGELEHGFKPENNSTWMCRSRVTTGRHAF